MSDACLLEGWSFCGISILPSSEDRNVSAAKLPVCLHFFPVGRTDFAAQNYNLHHSCIQVPRTYKRWRYSNVWWTWRQCVCCGVVYRWPLGVWIAVVRWTLSDQQSSQSRKIQNPLIETRESNERTKALCMKRPYHWIKLSVDQSHSYKMRACNWWEAGKEVSTLVNSRVLCFWLRVK